MNWTEDALEDETVDDGVITEACDDEPLFARLAVDKLKLGAHSKPKLDAAIADAAADGWRVAVRIHCSESDRHVAILVRPLTTLSAQPKRKTAGN